MKKITLIIVGLILLVIKTSNGQINLPAGFVDTIISKGWQSVVGLDFDKNGQMYVWEKQGKVWIVDTNNIKLQPPLLDITEEVGLFGDNGLTGFCLDPDFINNGYFYLFYTVDRYYLMNYGTPQYDSLLSETHQATICRVTRYQADKSYNFHKIVTGSRFILLGEDKKTGVPVLYPAHTGGTLLFGRDSTLIVSTADGSSYGDLDTGSVPSTYWMQAINDSIIPNSHNVGAFRAQLKGSLNGKILRINRFTGDGIKSNPYYDSTSVRSPQSRIYALGFRNPYRISIIPNTGNTDVTAGNPGVLLVGDVGWNTYEELDIIKSGGGNYGWPIYEGLNKENKYFNAAIPNIEAANPLFNGITCDQLLFTFSDLIKQETFNGIVSFPNPCDVAIQIPANLRQVHKRPDMDWRHNQAITRIPGFQGNIASAIQIVSTSSNVSGDMFAGNASIGGIYYSGNSFPFEYKNSYFHCDYGAGWINNFKLDTNFNITSVAPFDTAIGSGKIVFLTQNPRNGCLIYISYQNSIRQICYTGQVNYPPQAIIIVDTIYGGSPLTVNFIGSTSTDPENHPLTYLWDFGDTNSSTLANPSHVFLALPGFPTTYNVTLTVTDDSNYTSITQVKIFVNNSPPNVKINSISPGTQYSVLNQTLLALQASVSDAESPNSLLLYQWQTTLHHNSHTHPESFDNDSVTYTLLTPIGCDGEIYFYRISLTVTDPEGLSSYDYVDVYPACNVGIEDISHNNSSEIKVIANPNPTTGYVSLRIFIADKLVNKTVIVNVYNMNGINISENKYLINNGLSFADLPLNLNSDLSSGLYFIRININNKQICTKIFKL